MNTSSPLDSLFPALALRLNRLELEKKDTIAPWVEDTLKRVRAGEIMPVKLHLWEEVEDRWSSISKELVLAEQEATDDVKADLGLVDTDGIDQIALIQNRFDEMRGRLLDLLERASTEVMVRHLLPDISPSALFCAPGARPQLIHT